MGAFLDAAAVAEPPLLQELGGLPELACSPNLCGFGLVLLCDLSVLLCNPVWVPGTRGRLVKKKFVTRHRAFDASASVNVKDANTKPIHA